MRVFVLNCFRYIFFMIKCTVFSFALEKVYKTYLDLDIYISIQIGIINYRVIIASNFAEYSLPKASVFIHISYASLSAQTVSFCAL